MDALLPIAGIVSAFVTLVVFLGAVVVYLRGSKDAGTIKTLETYSAAQDKRITQLEADAARREIELAAHAARIELLEKENKQLRAERPSAEAIAELQTLVEESAALLAVHDRQTMALLRSKP
jgi:hypothetical protein